MSINTQNENGGTVHRVFCSTVLPLVFELMSLLCFFVSFSKFCFPLLAVTYSHICVMCRNVLFSVYCLFLLHIFLCACLLP
jgi:hypothetical protein